MAITKSPTPQYMFKKTTYIVSTYNSYEWITTRETYSLLFLKLQYMRQGWRVWDYPMWLAKLVYKYTGKPILRGRTAVFEKYIPGTDQITYHTPYHDMY
jgi:hypothetical protein